MAQRVVFTGKNKLHLEEFTPDPVGENQVGIRSIRSLMSTGTENIVLNRHFEPGSHWEHWVKYPFYPGYALIGEVDRIGKGVENMRKGDVVALRSGHASYHVTSPDSCQPVPPGLDPAQAAWFALGKIAFMGALRAEYAVGSDVLIIGAGPIGQMSVRWARAAGATRILVADMVEQRLDMARRGGATTSIPRGIEEAIDDIKKVNGGELPSIVVDTTGNAKVFPQALRAANWFGRVVLLGDTGSPTQQHLTTDVITKGLTIAGAHDGHENSTWNSATITELFFDLVTSDRFSLDGLITHTFAPEACVEAYETANTKRAETMGIVFHWTD